MSKNQLIIIKVGGNVIDNPSVLSHVLDDFSKIESRKILVHGGAMAALKTLLEKR